MSWTYTLLFYSSLDNIGKQKDKAEASIRDQAACAIHRVKQLEKQLLQRLTCHFKSVENDATQRIQTLDKNVTESKQVIPPYGSTNLYN